MISNNSSSVAGYTTPAIYKLKYVLVLLQTSFWFIFPILGFKSKLDKLITLPPLHQF
jgi:hypothetical protein